MPFLVWFLPLDKSMGSEAGFTVPRLLPSGFPRRVPLEGADRTRLLQKTDRSSWRLGGICFLYLGLTAIYCLFTPAWEANDELDHLANVEYVLQFQRLIPLRTEPWHETHQPPLYYLVCAGWQRLLGIPAFEPVELDGVQGLLTKRNPRLFYAHNYFPKELDAAVALHQIRLISVLLGLGTVLCTYIAGVLAFGQKEVGLSAAAFVAVLPKFNVISAAVTNDSLVIMLCSLILVLTLLLYNKTTTAGLLRSTMLICLGATAGAAVIAKLNSLPFLCFVLVSVLVLSPRRKLTFKMGEASLILLGFIGTSGWWILRNYLAEGTLLGQRDSLDWLHHALPRLIRVVPWTDAERFLRFVPMQLFESSWYRGGWNQFVLPTWMNLVLALAAGLSLLGVVCACFYGSRWIKKLDRTVLLLGGCCAMGVVAVLIIARTTTQAEGRIAYVGLPAFALLVTVGAVEVSRFIGKQKTKSLSHQPCGCGADPSQENLPAVALLTWPTLLLATNIYAILRFVIPFAGL